MTNPTASRAGKAIIRPMRRHRGFNLIELMIVVVVIAILASIAYPSYTRYVTDARRSEGQRLLLLAAAQQEKFYTQCGSYAPNFGTPLNCATGTLGIANTLLDVPFYSLVTPIVPAPGAGMTIANSYQLTATALLSQATNDTDCANLTLDSLGIKGQSGPNAQNRCWRR